MFEISYGTFKDTKYAHITAPNNGLVMGSIVWLCDNEKTNKRKIEDEKKFHLTNNIKLKTD